MRERMESNTIGPFNKAIKELNQAGHDFLEYHIFRPTRETLSSLVHKHHTGGDMRRYRSREIAINSEILTLQNETRTTESIERIHGKILALRNEAAVLKARFNIGDLIIDPSGFILRVDSIQAESIYTGREHLYKRAGL